ncbi:hypothetical protein [Legionella brunensis]|uniref:Uncharacterized protein n=1 Tax=Legionella brunensis TaxID=29422 RepID=A0A0W0SKV2_9GAMM|nr:hypothetical protein [Legionella brunensis]KTC83805.1 hypothetical protein Lbru_1628 [Legionella brunensis]
MTTQEIIDAYLNWYRTKSEKYWWAWEEVDNRRSAEYLSFIYELIQACRDDAEIAYVAAGPLENLFIKRHFIIKEPLSIMIRQNISIQKLSSQLFCRLALPKEKP